MQARESVAALRGPSTRPRVVDPSLTLYGPDGGVSYIYCKGPATLPELTTWLHTGDVSNKEIDREMRQVFADILPGCIHLKVSFLN